MRKDIINEKLFSAKPINHWRYLLQDFDNRHILNFRMIEYCYETYINVEIADMDNEKPAITFKVDMNVFESFVNKYNELKIKTK